MGRLLARLDKEAGAAVSSGVSGASNLSAIGGFGNSGISMVTASGAGGDAVQWIASAGSGVGRDELGYRV